MRTRALTLTLIFMLLSIQLSLTHGQTPNKYYVSPEGDDTHDGSVETPWRTINHSVSQLKPGDTLYIRGGVFHESIQITVSGTPNSIIKIQNYPEENPIIDGVELEGNGLLISASYIMLSGLEIRNWNENGVWVESSQYIEICNCVVHSVFYGIGFSDGSHDFKIRNCTLTDFTLYGFDASASGGEDCYNGVIENCRAFYGSDPGQNVDGFAMGHGAQTGFSFIDCVAYGVYDGFDISSDDTYLINCLAFECSNAGYKIWGDNVTLINCIGFNSNTNLELDWSGTPKTVSVLNSDLVKAETFNIWVENSRDNLIIYNSVITCGENIGLAFEDGFRDNYLGDYNVLHNWNPERMVTFSYNKEYSLQDLIDNKWSQDTGQDNNSVFIDDPYVLFEDLDNMNLYPANGSPLINSADQKTSVNYDFNSNARPNGSGSDIGAYEYYENIEAEKVEVHEKPNFIFEDETFVEETDYSRLIGLGVLVLIISIVALWVWAR